MHCALTCECICKSLDSSSSSPLPEKVLCSLHSSRAQQHTTSAQCCMFALCLRTPCITSCSDLSAFVLTPLFPTCVFPSLPTLLAHIFAHAMIVQYSSAASDSSQLRLASFPPFLSPPSPHSYVTLHQILQAGSRLPAPPSRHGHDT